MPRKSSAVLVATMTLTLAAATLAQARKNVSHDTPFGSATATTVKPNLLCVPARVEIP
jgi:hypothetical protein